MKGQFLSAVSFLAATGAAAPGGCQDYSYDIPSCDSCHYPGREFFGDSCHKECPKEYRQCKDNKYEHKDYQNKGNNNNFQLEVDYSQQVQCPKDYSYDVQVKVETCSSGDYSGKDCLNVYYNNGHGGNYKRSSISQSNLGIYLSQENQYNPHDFNYNNYCHEDRCEVPAQELPSYPDLCEKEFYLAVGNNECYDNYSYKDYSSSTKYIKVKVSCNEYENKQYENNNDHCKEECCCYSH